MTSAALTLLTPIKPDRFCTRLTLSKVWVRHLVGDMPLPGSSPDAICMCTLAVERLDIVAGSSLASIECVALVSYQKVKAFKPEKLYVDWLHEKVQACAQEILHLLER
jgi:hypothetical protein